MEVTVKTLDSQNHKYSVPNEITVREFKDRIASSVSIPADKQRLIYCGRVLQDDKNLSDYDVHEKVIHLVMRAPPQASSSSTSRNHSSNSGDYFQRSRASASTRGPSSSGVRLQQAKTMLDRASEVLDQLEELFPSASVNTRPSPAHVNDATESNSEPMEESNESEPSTSSRGGEGSSGSASQPSEEKEIPPSTLTMPATIPNEDLQNLFTEMDFLNSSYSYNSMDTGMIGGGTSASLAGGLAQAASAAFASALSSMNEVNSGEATEGRRTDSNATTTTTSSTPRTTRPVSSATARTTRSVNSSTTTTAAAPTSSSSQPQANGQGMTLIITNPGPRTPSLRLEHPRCSVMVQVLDRYQDVNRRLQPFLHHFYTVMASDTSYENENDPRMRSDQYVIWRVSAVMHFLSHAMHAVSDIIIDLRRTPPRQLRARPIIIPQPIIQARINLAATAEPNPVMRSSGSQSATPIIIRTSSSSTGPRSTPPTTTSVPNLPHNLLALENGMVVMHVGPSGFSIDSLPDDSFDEASHPRELLQNLMSTLTSQLEMGFGSSPPTTTTTTTNSSQNSSASPPTTPGGVRNAAPVHNSQAGGNSGTNTTNATHTRVTPRPHVHVTPLHMPGMGSTQFDPILPCSSQHIRQTGRRRHRATNQTPPSNNSARSNTQTQAEPETAPSTFIQSESTASRVIPENLLGFTAPETSSENLTEDQQQQNNVFAQLIQGVVAEIFTTLGVSRDSESQSRVSLHDFLEPIVGARNLTSSEADSNNFFVRLFDIISHSLSLQDLVQLFCGDSGRLGQLREPLQQFIRSKVLNDGEESEDAINNGVEAVIDDMNPYITESSTDVRIHEGIDYILTMQNFARIRLRLIFKFILDSENTTAFGSGLYRLLNRSYEDFITLCIRILSDGASGLERIIEGRMNAIMSDLSSSIQSMSLSISLRHIRLALSRGVSITESQLQQYIVAPRVVQSPEVQQEQKSNSEEPSNPPVENINGNGNMEAMDVDDIGRVEEVATSEVSMVPEARHITITVGPRPLHSAVPQDWIPVITRDVERQRNVRTDNSLSDGYLCGMPLKRRKIATQNKPHGNVHKVMQDNLRQSLKSSGVNRSLIESVSGEVTNELADSFVTHVRSTLREQLRGNQDFIPEKFPKSEQKIRNKQ